MLVFLEPGMKITRDTLLQRLVELQYERNDIDFKRGSFRVRGDVVEVYPSYQDEAYRVELWGDVQSRLERRSVHQVDRVSGVLDTIQERIEPLREPVLRELPRRVPRRWIRPSESEDFVIVVEPHHLFIDEVDVGR